MKKFHIYSNIYKKIIFYVIHLSRYSIYIGKNNRLLALNEIQNLNILKNYDF